MHACCGAPDGEAVGGDDEVRPARAADAGAEDGAGLIPERPLGPAVLMTAAGVAAASGTLTESENLI